MAYESRLEIVIDSTTGERRLKSLEKRLELTDRAGDGLTRSTGNVNSELRRLSTIAAAAQGALFGLVGVMSVRQIIEYSDTWTNVNNQLRQVTDSAAGLSSVQRELMETAQDTRSSYEGTANLYARLARSSTELELSQSDLLGITKTINQSFATSGATAGEAAAAITQLSQGLASGALRGDEFNSVSEQAPDIMRAIASSLDMTIGQLRAFAAEGGITAEVVVSALQQASDEIDGRFSNSVETFSQRMEKANNNLLEWVGTSEEISGASGLAGAALLGLSENLDEVVTVGMGVSTLFAGRMAGSLATAAGGMLTARLEALRYQSSLTSLAGVSRTAAAGQIALGTATRGAAGALALVGGPVGAAVLAGGAMYYYREELGLVTPVVQSATDRVDDMTSALDANSEAALKNAKSMLEAERQFQQFRQATLAMDVTRQREIVADEQKQWDAVGGQQAFGMGQRSEAQQALHELQVELMTTRNAIDAAGGSVTEIDEKLAQLEKTTRDVIPPSSNLGDSTSELAKAAKDAEREADQFARTLQSLTDRLYPVEAAQRTYREEQELLTLAWAKGEIGVMHYLDALNRLQEAQLSTQTASAAYGQGFGSEISARGGVGAPTDPMAGIGGNQDQDYWSKWLESAETAFSDFDQLAANTAENFQRGFGNAFESMIFDSESARDAFGNLFDGMARTIVSALGEMAAQWVAYQAIQMAMGKSAEAAAIGSAVATGSSIAAAYAPAAAAASLASFGANAAPAMVGMTSTFALGKTLSLSGMAHDGIDRVPREGTWLLDKGERVLNAPQTDRLDNYLSRQERGGESAAKNDGGSGVTIVNINEDASKAGKSSTQQDDQGRKVIDIWVANAMGDGKVHKVLETKYGLRTKGQ